MWAKHPLDEYPKIQEFCEKIENLSGIRECLDKHKDGWCIPPDEQLTDL